MYYSAQMRGVQRISGLRLRQLRVAIIYMHTQIMRLIVGCGLVSISHRCDRRNTAGAYMPDMRRAVGIALDTCKGMAYLHRHGY